MAFERAETALETAALDVRSAADEVPNTGLPAADGGVRDYLRFGLDDRLTEQQAKTGGRAPAARTAPRG